LSAIRKEYKRPFILEETKLTRLLEVMHGCLASPDVVTNDHFEVFLGKNRVEEATNLDEVFGTVNSRENPVHRLVLTCSAPAPNPGHRSHEIQVDFDGEAIETSPTPSGPIRKITVIIRSDAHGWASRTLSAVEEQVDRTRFDDLGHRRVLGLIVLLLLIFIGGLLAASGHFRLSEERPPGERTMWLSEADIHQLARTLETNKTLTEEQVRQIVTMQLRNVTDAFAEPVSDQIPSSPTSNRRAWEEALLLFVPLVMVFVMAFYLLVHCYPSALFLWGDAIGRYENLKQTRSILWSAVIGTTFVSVVANAFRAGLLSYLAR
jgi:hypothetical protein